MSVPTANDFTAPLALVRYRGDDDITIPLIDPNTGEAFVATGHTLIFTVKALETDVDLDALVQKISTVGGITVASPTVVTLLAADFSATALEARKTYYFDVQAQHAVSGLVKTVARGTLYFQHDITRETTLSIPTTTTPPAALPYIPVGGTDGQVLTKQSATDHDADWEDPAATGDVAGDTHAATAKATPVDADELPLVDSAAGWALKKLTWANFKATLKTYFDGLYAAVTNLAVNGQSLVVSLVWSNVATTFTGFLLNVTDTASAADSRLAQFQANGVDKAVINKYGELMLNTTSPAIHTERANYPAIWLGASNSGIMAEPGIGYRGLIYALNGAKNLISSWTPIDTTKSSWLITHGFDQDSIDYYRAAAGVMNLTSGAVNIFSIKGTGKVGIGQASPTAVLHLKAGTATASTAPLKFTSGALLTTPEAGAVEYLSGMFYLRGEDLALRNLTPTGGNGLAAFTVATLPATAAAGMFTGSCVYVTDSNATLTAGIGAIVAAGGSFIVPVFYDGTNWRIG